MQRMLHIGQPSSEMLYDGLMSKAYPQNREYCAFPFEEFHHSSSLFRDSGPRGKHYPVEASEAVKGDGGVLYQGQFNRRFAFTEHLDDIINEGVVIVYNQYIHNPYKINIISHIFVPISAQMMKASEVFAKINSSAAQGRSFVFGVDFDKTEGFFFDDPLEASGILFSIRGVSNCSAPPLFPTHTPSIEVVSADRDSYRRGFSTVMSALRRGDTFLVNLTAATPVSVDIPVEEIFFRSEAPYRLCMPGRFVCFSPEPFVRISGDVIRTFPMKGTIDASVADAENRLMEDYKELCEHNTIVDLMRNDLNMVASGVKVERFRYIDRIRTVRGEILQTSSEISGILPPGWKASLGDILSRILPAGSISGAPKASTVDVIHRSESSPRGYYTGVFGYFDGESLDSAVAIRFIESRDGKYCFRSGGGITVNSSMEEEYDEVLEKIYLSLK